MNELIELQASIEQIKSEIGFPDYYIEQAILEHIEKYPNKELRYIQHEYENDILQVVTWIGAEHGLKVFKKCLPEDCTYITIKAIFRKHGLGYINGKSLEAA